MTMCAAGSVSVARYCPIFRSLLSESSVSTIRVVSTLRAAVQGAYLARALNKGYNWTELVPRRSAGGDSIRAHSRPCARSS